MKRSVLFLLLLLLPIIASGETIADLYQATVLVASRNQNDFQLGLIQAYKQVLIKVSGDPNIIASPIVQQNIGTLNNIIQRYSYNVTTTDNGEPELLLQISFDPTSIHQILHQAGQKSWNKNRPLTIIWLVYNDGKGLTILNNDANNDMSKAIEAASQLRGLPVLLPMMDLQDMNLISPQDIWTFNTRNLEQASARYHINDILAGRISQTTNGKWHADWLWLLDNQTVSWQTQGQTIPQTIGQVIDNLTSALVQRHAMLATNALKTQLTVKILNVEDLGQYSSVMHYLKSLTPVKRVELLNIQSQDVLVQITIRGREQDLVQVLEQQQILEPVQGTDDNEGVDLTLKWQGSH